MNALRLSGSAVRATCSADTMAAWMTSRSGSARSTASASSSVRCGVTATAQVTPASLISAMRWPISSGLTGSA